jgi:hypothetical protein
MIFHLSESIIVCVEKHMWNIPDKVQELEISKSPSAYFLLVLCNITGEPCISDIVLLAELVVLHWDLSLVSLGWGFVNTFVTGKWASRTIQSFLRLFSCKTHFKVCRCNLGRTGNSSSQFCMYTFLINRSLLRDILRVFHMDSL